MTWSPRNPTPLALTSHPPDQPDYSSVTMATPVGKDELTDNISPLLQPCKQQLSARFPLPPFGASSARSCSFIAPWAILTGQVCWKQTWEPMDESPFLYVWSVLCTIFQKDPRVCVWVNPRCPHGCPSWKWLLGFLSFHDILSWLPCLFLIAFLKYSPCIHANKALSKVHEDN